MKSFFLLNDENEIKVNENFAGYLIFYHKNQDPAVAEIQLNLFSKLIENGLKLKMDNFLVVDFSSNKNRLSTYIKKLNISKCFLFGVSQGEIGINVEIPMYNLTTVGTIEFLKADAPEKIETSKNLKSGLWTQLQLSFKLN